jgi:phytoene/squalene synthetase
MESFFEIFNSIDFNQVTDHPNILIAARFWEEERYGAAKICYKFMRAIDDIIDDHKASKKIIAPAEQKKFTADVNNWLKLVFATGDGNPLNKELTETIEKFRIPLWPLEAFAKSMIYDINNDGFQTLNSFLEYSHGATVAPASIFVHLTGITKRNGFYEKPHFDVREAATPCAIFSYFVHIIRDFQKDQLNNLNYFSDDLMAKNGLTRSDLKEMANGRPVNENFRNLIYDYFSVADKYRLETYNILKKIRPHLELRYQLSLEIIFNLYLMVFEKINIQKGKFTAEELNPTPEETRKRVYETIMNFKSA